MKGKRSRRREGRQKPVWTVKTWGVGELGKVEWNERKECETAACGALWSAEGAGRVSKCQVSVRRRTIL